MKWYVGVLPYEPGRYGGDARPCSAFYPSEAALRRNWDLDGAEIVVVELPDSQSDAGAKRG